MLIRKVAVLFKAACVGLVAFVVADAVIAAYQAQVAAQQGI